VNPCHPNTKGHHSRGMKSEWHFALPSGDQEQTKHEKNAERTLCWASVVLYLSAWDSRSVTVREFHSLRAQKS
jgi:hypothetical protein